MRRVGKTLADSAVVREENRKNQEEPANGGRFLTVSRHDKNSYLEIEDGWKEDILQIL